MNSPTDTRFLGETGDLQALVPLPRLVAPEHYALEVERIFRRSWLLVANTADLPESGSYLVLDMPTLSTSVLLTRGKDGRIRAFHNICIHRGNKLVRAGAGTKPAHTCGFHGWTYSLEGRLVGVTDRQMFGEVDLESMTLPGIHCEVWHTLVFLNFDREPRETLTEWLDVMAPQYDGYFGTPDANKFEKINSLQVVTNGSWHLGVNAFTEGYHTMFIHRNTVPDYQGGKNNPMRHRPHMELMKRHSRYSAPSNPDHKVTPAEDVCYRYGHKLFPEFRVDGSHLPAGVNPSKVEQWAFDVIELFPNHVMLTGANWHMNMWFWPMDAGRTLIRMDNYAYRAKNAGEKLGHAYFAARGREVFREDINTIEATQAMLRSNAIDNIILSRQELALQHHFRVVQQMVAEA
jgi:Rieske 2Fe-2S family protein